MRYVKILSLIKLSLVLLLCSSLIHCGKKGSGGSDANDPEPPVAPIRVTTFTVISKTRTAADGFSSAVIKIKVLDQEGQPVSHYVMRLISPVAAGVNYTKCGDSDAQGILTCEVRAHLDGTKTLTVAGSNSTFDVEFTRYFDGRGVKFEAVAMSHAKESAGPDKVSATAGARYSIPRQQSGTDLMINDVSVSN